jgi:transglutaminase-like putative cysteine protease
MHEDLTAATRPTELIDSGHPAIRAFAEQAAAGARGPTARAVALYYAVRDGFRYDPYRLDLSVEGLKASRVLSAGFGWCVTKASLLAAACRALGVPARVGFADVRNHLSTARMRLLMGTDVFYYHGYTALHLDGRWVKATPAFNVELCQKLGIHTLEFDGATDSIYQPFDLAGHRHMEYLALHGERDEVPREELLRAFAEHYPAMPRLDGASFDEDVAREAAGNLTQS